MTTQPNLRSQRKPTSANSKKQKQKTKQQPNIARHTTGVWTKAYLRQQLLVALAGRAGEELVFGPEELSSLNQARLQLARQVAHKLLNAGMSAHPDFANIRTLGHNYMDPSMEPSRWTQYTVTTDTNQSRSEWVDTDMELEALLNDGYAEAKALLARSRGALDALAEALLEAEALDGDRVREIVEANADAGDLAARAAALKEAAFI